MSIFLKAKWIKINQINSFEKHSFNPIPQQFKQTYLEFLDLLVQHQTNLIEHIKETVGRVIIPPVDELCFKRYLTGYNLQYVGVKNAREPNFEGYWAFNNGNPIILYNSNRPYKRQRYTKTHETFHFMQSIDQEFLSIYDKAINSQNLPPKLATKAMERATEKATAIFLTPKELFEKEYKNGHTTIEELSDIFQVSKQSAEIRLKELGLNYAPAW